MNMEKKRKTTSKEKWRFNYKWVKQAFLEIDELKNRIDKIEEFLGGQESIYKILKDRKAYKSEKQDNQGNTNEEK